MLNISNGNIGDPGRYSQLESLKVLQSPKAGRTLARWLSAIGFIGLAILFLPWQQNIRATGSVTAFSPENRPQTIESTIPGRIKQWYVQEGKYVSAGDTILSIKEVQDKYFDPKLLLRLEEQIESKQSSIDAKYQKIGALRRQIKALRNALIFKLEQTRNKVKQNRLKLEADSIAYEAEKINFRLQQNQFERKSRLFDQGLKSLTDIQKEEQKLQETKAKFRSKENKYLTSQNELINAKIELNSTEAEYLDKISKAESDLSNTQANVAESEGGLAKLKNEYANMQIRADQYHIVAPQSGFVVKAMKAGIGETIKGGEGVVTIMPSSNDVAVAMYVKPRDVPLLSKGRKVRIEFDGWPALQFSGWPSVSVGTFGGIIKVIDFVETKNKMGKYRILVQPDPDEEPWPRTVRLGSGAKGFALLEEVPVWYEIWRLYNGFPPRLKTVPNEESGTFTATAKAGSEATK